MTMQHKKLKVHKNEDGSLKFSIESASSYKPHNKAANSLLYFIHSLFAQENILEDKGESYEQSI